MHQCEKKCEHYFKNGYVDHIAAYKFLDAKKRLDNLSFDSILEYGQSLCESFINDFVDAKHDIEFYGEKYKLYYLSGIMYQEFKNEKNSIFIQKKNTNLDQTYNKKGISLRDEDKQYRKYNLISIGDHFELKISTIPKIYDKKNNQHILLNGVSINILNILDELYKKGSIVNLELLPNFDVIGESIEDVSILTEELEVPKHYHFGTVKKESRDVFKDIMDIPVTNLYSSKGTYDNLWIVVDKNNITFEEIKEDFVIFKDKIVTQVIHLEYFLENGIPYINHIDHEYIFYSEDEYENRQRKHSQKGESQKRIKTFKVDNSRIPFITDDGGFILYKILSECFDKEELLVDYFKQVLKHDN